MSAKLRAMVAGLGNMGMSHALAYAAHPEAELVGLVNRSAVVLPDGLGGVEVETTFAAGLARFRPDLVCVATYTDSHAEYAIAAMEAGADVFVEKPLARTAQAAAQVVETARRLKRKLVVGYILRHHPGWQRLVTEARNLGGPYVFRLNLNQQSHGETWEVHKALMQSTSPIVDCGVHYVDVMCQITDAAPLRVHGIGLRLSHEIAPTMYNYGQFQVVFEDGSVGWYEAGWGPMMSQTAYFVKDIISPGGAVSIVGAQGAALDSDSVERHTQVGALRLHPVAGEDHVLSLPDEPGHQGLCDAEADFMVAAIREDRDLDRHMTDALQSLRICLAADESIRAGRAIAL